MTPLDVGLLDDRGQLLLGHPAGLEKGREVAAAPRLGNAQLDGAGADLPVTLAVAVAPVDALRAPLAVPGAGQPGDSNSISRCAVNPIVSRSRSASELFSSSALRAIISSSSDPQFG